MFFIFIFTLTVNNRINVLEKDFLENVFYFRFLNFSILTTNNAKYFFNLSPLVSGNVLVLFLSLFSDSLGENKFVYSNKR